MRGHLPVEVEVSVTRSPDTHQEDQPVGWSSKKVTATCGGDLDPITKTCAPRQDVLAGGLADNHFAAQLDQVVRSPKEYPVYGDPDEFFALTYPTQGLRDLLERTFGRLTGAKVEGAQH